MRLILSPPSAVRWVAGGVESTKGMWDAMSDENTVVFTDNEAFEKARDIIEMRRRQQRNPTLSGGASAAEQLEKLASLLEKGLLTRPEFDAQKAALLGETVSTSAAVCESSDAPSEPPAAKMSEPAPGLEKMHAAMDRAIASRQEQVVRPFPPLVPSSSTPSFGRRGL